MTSNPSTSPSTAADWVRLPALQGQDVILQPLTRAHAAGIRAAVTDGELWRLWFTTVPAPDGVDAEIERRLTLQARGSMMPFAVESRADGRVLGMTSFMNIDLPNRRLEIGSTWYRASVQQTGINAQCKLLLLSMAFDTLGCNAVELRTSSFNFRSRAAIERLGAKLDGVLRHHQIAHDDVLRDTYVYSIIASEWPAVKQNLQWRLERRLNPPQG